MYTGPVTNSSSSYWNKHVVYFDHLGSSWQLCSLSGWSDVICQIVPCCCCHGSDYFCWLYIWFNFFRFWSPIGLDFPDNSGINSILGICVLLTIYIWTVVCSKCLWHFFCSVYCAVVVCSLYIWSCLLFAFVKMFLPLLVFVLCDILRERSFCNDTGRQVCSDCNNLQFWFIVNLQ